jgi:photosystem II stability/assembly factor-like uncharacterized protein
MIKVLKLIVAVVLVAVAVVLGLIRFNPDFLSMGDWTPIQPARARAVKSLADLGGGLIVAGLEPWGSKAGGAAFSTDYGRTWEYDDRLPQQNEVTEVIRLSPERKVLFATVFDNNADGTGGIFRSRDLGKTWEQLSGQLPVEDCRAVVAMPGDPPEVFIGLVGHGVFASADEGETWEPRNEGLGGLYIQDLAVGAEGSGRLFAATLRGLFVTEDRGRSWRRIPFPAPGRPPFILDITPHPADPTRIYVLERPQSGRTRLWVSEDAGETWRECGWRGTPPEFHPRCILLDAQHPARVFVGTVLDGVFLSEDGGRTWSSMNAGLPLRRYNIMIHDMLLVREGTPRLLAGTDRAGMIYVSPLESSGLSRLAARIRAF